SAAPVYRRPSSALAASRAPLVSAPEAAEAGAAEAGGAASSPSSSSAALLCRSEESGSEWPGRSTAQSWTPLRSMACWSSAGLDSRSPYLQTWVPTSSRQERDAPERFRCCGFCCRLRVRDLLPLPGRANDSRRPQAEQQ